MKAAGSFTKKEDIEDLMKGLSQPEKPDIKPKPQPNPVKEELTDKEKALEEREELLDEIKKELEIEITEDDMWNSIFNSNLTKSNISIFPGKVHATFKYGLNVDELSQIDKAMATALEEKWMETGFKSLNTRHLLSHVLLEVGKPAKLKSIGSTPEERFEAIGEMNTILVEMLAKKWNMFLFLMDETAKQEKTLKK